MDNPRPWLRYVEAGDLESSTFDFDGLNVENSAGDRLGDVNGFILDASAGQPYYVVVDSKGWFKTKHYLLPIGHVRLDAGRKALIADLTRDNIRNFPGFDLDKFGRWSNEDLERFGRQTADACGMDVTVAASDPSSRWDSLPHYRQPSWWDPNYYSRDRAGAAGMTAGAAMFDRSRNDSTLRGGDPREAAIPDRESIVAQADDTSPHLGGRAQAGDVIGIETGGERTYLGDTSEDENERRREAEKAARELEK
jgi:hypothetical protein